MNNTAVMETRITPLLDLYSMLDNCPKYIFAAVLLDAFYRGYITGNVARIGAAQLYTWNVYMCYIEEQEKRAGTNHIQTIQALIVLTMSNKDEVYDEFSYHIGPWLQAEFPNCEWYGNVDNDIENLQHIAISSRT